MIDAAGSDDPGRIDLLAKLAERTLSDDPAEGVELLRTAIDDARRLGRTGDLPDLYRRLSHAAELSGDLRAAISAAERALSTSGPDESESRADLHLELTRLYQITGDYPTALENAQDAIDLYRNVGDQRGLALALKGRADLYAGVGDTAHALGFYFDALRIAEEADAEEINGVLLSDIALLQSEQGDHERAIEHLLRARKIFSVAGLPGLEVRTLTNLASVAAACDRYEEGLDYGLRAMAIYTAHSDHPGLATTLANLSRIYRALEDPASALECSRKAYDLFELLGDDHGRGTVLLNSGMIYFSIGEYQNAVFIIEQALDVATDGNLEGLRLECHELLSKSFEELGNTAPSLDHLRSAVAIRDEIEQEKRRRGLADLQAQYDLERAEKEREIYRLKNEQLESENRYKTDELTSMSIRLVEKSRFLNDIRRAIEKVRERIPEEGKDEIDEILRKIRDNIRREGDWEAFEEQFRKVHHDFMERLSRQAPDLTPTELKVSALIRTGLSSAEIASLFHVTRRNIETHRYRLRKKLELPTSISLSTYFAKM